MTQEKKVIESIEEHRRIIDELDERIVALLNERATQSLAIRILKPDVHMPMYDPQREEEIFKHVESVCNGPMYAENIRAIYSTVLKVMKELRL